MADMVKDDEMMDGDAEVLDYGGDDERVQDGLADKAVEGMCAPLPHVPAQFCPLNCARLIVPAFPPQTRLVSAFRAVASRPSSPFCRRVLM